MEFIPLLIMVGIFIFLKDIFSGKRGGSAATSYRENKKEVFNQAIMSCDKR
ncbi:MAG TPA: hypothetical protein PKI92_02590 [Candidatus Woesebacteria bacterium]|nr:hypothetical protein [Candidatus Woesebacteria bacterium]HPR99407.1 hypothetical protein [Candidatus Woesebacteria bacterium]